MLLVWRLFLLRWQPPMTVIGHLSSTLGLTLSNTTFNLTLHHSALFTLSLSSQWPEWMADVPLLCYITIALEDKEYLEVEDFLIIFGFFGMIAFGYVMNLTTGYHPTPPFTSVRFISISISISINPINQVVHLKVSTNPKPNPSFPYSHPHPHAHLFSLRRHPNGYIFPDFELCVHCQLLLSGPGCQSRDWGQNTGANNFLSRNIALVRSTHTQHPLITMKLSFSAVPILFKPSLYFYQLSIDPLSIVNPAFTLYRSFDWQVILEAQRSTSSPITSRKKWLLGTSAALGWLLDVSL